MHVSAIPRLLLVLAIVLGLGVYAVVVDVGISAGKIHRGVHVRGFDVGGLTEADAAQALAERGRLLQERPIVLTTEGFDCRFVPSELGWGPQPFDTARLAMAVGRTGGWLGALAHRWRAWTEGVNVPWSGSPDASKVGRFLNECEKLARGMGVTLDRGRARFLIRRAIERWPRSQTVDLPGL